MNFALIILVILGILVFYIFGTYNRFQTLKVRIKAQIQEIGNQLKRQAELIPNLLAAAEKYLKHERGIIKDITEARKLISEAEKSGTVKKLDQAQEAVTKVLGAVRVLVENTPQIQAIGSINILMENLRDTADKLMYARRTLIDLGADYNRMLFTIPSNLVGKIFGFKEEKGLATPLAGEHLEVSEKDLKTPKIS